LGKIGPQAKEKVNIEAETTEETEFDV